MKTIIKLVTMALITSSMFTSNAFAHGSLDPKHGGVVQEAHDMVSDLLHT